ncbi:MAG: tRNA pseudouridine(55) synthase TruB [Gemmatimonadetes bacterium]|nr:tRNA pseudouridine(55) synthase TruB [Gemmatimonadota bacterium]
MNGEPNGVLPVDKPEGPTSHDVVAGVRRALRIRRVGHTGTLDPFASGLLLLCVGRATRLAEYLSRLGKTYRAVARLGVTTDTDDRTGRELARSERWRELSAAAVEAAFTEQQGERLQVPPAFSAKRLEGERLYRRARRGEALAPAPVPVTIHRLEILVLELPDVHFEVECSSGTYVRAMARDAGVALGTGAHLVTLRRTRIGPHEVAGALPLDALEDAEARARAWLTPLAVLAHLPAVEITDEGARAGLRNGVPITLPDGAPREGVVLAAWRGELLAVGEAVDGRLRPRKVFHDA